MLSGYKEEAWGKRLPGIRFRSESGKSGWIQGTGQTGNGFRRPSLGITASQLSSDCVPNPEKCAAHLFSSDPLTKPLRGHTDDPLTNGQLRVESLVSQCAQHDKSQQGQRTDQNRTPPFCLLPHAPTVPSLAAGDESCCCQVNTPELAPSHPSQPSQPWEGEKLHTEKPEAFQPSRRRPQSCLGSRAKLPRLKEMSRQPTDSGEITNDYCLRHLGLGLFVMQRELTDNNHQVLCPGRATRAVRTRTEAGPWANRSERSELFQKLQSTGFPHRVTPPFV